MLRDSIKANYATQSSLLYFNWIYVTIKDHFLKGKIMKYSRSGPYLGKIAGQISWVYFEFSTHGLFNIRVGQVNYDNFLPPFWFNCTSVKIPTLVKFRTYSFEDNSECLQIINDQKFCHINLSTHSIRLYNNHIVPSVRVLDENHKLRNSYTKLSEPAITEEITQKNREILQIQYVHLQQYNQVRALAGAKKALDLIYYYYFHLDAANLPQMMMELYEMEQALTQLNAQGLKNDDEFIYAGIHVIKEAETEKQLTEQEVFNMVDTDACNLRAKIIVEMNKLIRSPSSVSDQVKFGIFSFPNYNSHAIEYELVETSRPVN